MTRIQSSNPTTQTRPTTQAPAPTQATPAPAQAAEPTPLTQSAAEPRESVNVRSLQGHAAPVVEINFEVNGAKSTKAPKKSAGVQSGQGGETQTVKVSAYGPGLYGNKTADGTRLTPNTVGVAHKKLPLGTKVEITVNGRTVPATVIDRGPYVGDRKFDLTNGLIKQLGFKNCSDFGVRSVQVRVLD